MTYAVYYNKRVTNEVEDENVWAVFEWDPATRGRQIGSFRFIEIKTDCMLYSPDPLTKWPRGVLLVEGELVANNDGTAYFREKKDESRVIHDACPRCGGDVSYVGTEKRRVFHDNCDY